MEAASAANEGDKGEKAGESLDSVREGVFLGAYDVRWGSVETGDTCRGATYTRGATNLWRGATYVRKGATGVVAGRHRNGTAGLAFPHCRVDVRTQGVFGFDQGLI